MDHDLKVPLRDSIKLQLASTVFGAIAMIFFIGATGGMLSVYLRQQNLWSMALSFGWISGIVITLIAIFFVIFRVRRIITPLIDLTIIAKKLGLGDLNARSSYKSKNEIGILSATFNQMADQLQEKIQALENTVNLKDEFIGITSHNLKTPLIIIRGHLEKIMKQRDTLPDDIKQSIDTINNQANRLKFIDDRLLSIVKIQGNILNLDLKINNIIDTLHQVISHFQDQIKEKNLKINTSIPISPVNITYDQEWIEECLENVLSNAIKYTPQDGTITIALKDATKSVEISVEDTGIGISQEEQTNLFQPFHRAQDVLDANYEGLGLGLYIVKLIIEKHHGNISLQSEKGKGTEIVINLPK